MKNWAQNKKNPANRVRVKFDDFEYGDLSSTIGYISALSAIGKKNAKKRREEQESEVGEVKNE